jgi:glycosyltransferase involved in cell wall biosynthesis
LVLSPEKRRELGVEARRKIEKNFAIDKFVKMVEELYFKVRGEM